MCDSSGLLITRLEISEIYWPMVSRGCEVVRLWGQGRPITRPTLCTGLSQYLTISTGAGGNFKPGSRKQREGRLGHSFVK